jgi:ATP:ADP antiporter, AAA family
MSSLASAASSDTTLLDRWLAPVSKVRAGEGLGAVLLACNACLLLFTYYILKTVREPLILGQPNGAVIKSFSTALQAGIFLIVVPLYGLIASRFRRMGLMTAVSAFFITNLALFCAAGLMGINIGIVFYLWLGIFNMLAVSQFWAFANDLYTEEEGKRLFPIVGIGASLGAWLGSVAAEKSIRTAGTYTLMAVSAGLLGLYLALIWIINRRETNRVGTARAQSASAPLDRKGGFQLVLKDAYLRWIAILILLLNAVNTTGEYILGRFVAENAAHLPEAARSAYIGEFYGSYFAWVSLTGFLLQTFVCARLFEKIGLGGSLFVLPLVSLTGYGILLTLPLLGIVRVAKVMENSVDYSINNTVRHALFLRTSREAKYKSKAAIDTFFTRAGDLISFGVVVVGTNILNLSVAGFAAVNMILTGFWIFASYRILREYKRVAAPVEHG